MSAEDSVARLERRRAAGMLEGVFDAHTHLFPDRMLAKLRDWFDANAWRPTYRGAAEQGLEVVREAGATRSVALIYSHKPDMSEGLNAFLGEVVRAHPDVVGVGTVFPGEPDAKKVAKRAIDVHGLRGIKLHCHVQRMAIDAPETLEVLELCQEMGVVAVVHSGREPASPGYGFDVHSVCDVDRTDRVLARLPRLKLVVPHFGFDEIDGYLSLLAKHENLHLDTAMVCTDYFPEAKLDWARVEANADRVLYGTDFPIIPYEATRELETIAKNIVDDAAFDAIVRGNAGRLWDR